MKIKIYHPTEGERWLSSVDWSAAWQQRGWRRSPIEVVQPEPPTPQPEPEIQPDLESEAEPITKTVEERQAELEAMSWAEVREIAEGYGIVKPVSGWMDAIPLILAVEYGNSV